MSPSQSLQPQISVAQKNVLGQPLAACCYHPKTGFFRDGFCHTGPMDIGSHTVCAEMTESFLTYSKREGNDLSTPRPEFDFPGLKPGDRWCVCALRWKDAYDDGVAPPVILEACNQTVLDIIPLDVLKAHAIMAAH